MPDDERRSIMSRREFLVTLGAAAGGGLLAACSPAPQAAPAPTTAPAAGAAPTTAAAAPAAPTKAPAAASNLTIKALVRAGSNPGPPRDQNTWWQALEKRLGVARLDVDFTPTANYNEKLSVVLAGGDLPDIIYLDEWSPVVLQAAAQGAFMPWDEFVGKDYKIKDAKRWPGLASLPARSWRNSAVNGKIYGAPGFYPTAGETLFMRHDWMQKLNLGTKQDFSKFDPDIKRVADKCLGGEIRQPTSRAELEAIWKAYTEKDPDGNGKNDTLGFMMSQAGAALSMGPQGLVFFLNSFGVPHRYIEKPDGSLSPTLYEDTFKEAVLWAADSYKLGVIDPDFQATNSSQRDQKIAAGKGGSWFHVVSGFATRYRNLIQANPSARLWAIDPVPAVAGRKPVTYNNPGWVSVTLISAKAARDPGRREKLMEILDFYANPDNEKFILFGDEGAHHTVDKDGQPQKKPELGDFNSNMLISFGSPPIEHYRSSTPNPAYEVKDLNTSYRDVTKRLEAYGVDDPAWGLISDVYRQRGKALDDYYNISLTNFITGKTPMSDWDKFIAEWKGRGGEAVVADLSRLNLERRKSS